MANNQTPIQEAGERLGEAIPGISMIPKMEAIVDGRQRQKAHLRRVEDDHRQGKEAIRMVTGLKTEPPEGNETESEEVGDSFSVAGDTTTTTTHHHYYPKPDPPPPTVQQPTVAPGVQEEQSRPPAETPPTAAEPAWKTWARRAALVAAGAGGIAGYQWWNKPDEKPPTIEQPVVGSPGAYWKYGVEVIPPPEQ